MSAFWYVVIALAIVANWLFAQFVFKPWLARRKYAKAEAPAEEGEITVKETCEIVGRAGEVAPHPCGHEAHVLFKVVLWGEPYLDKHSGGPGKYCPDCLLSEIKKASRRCGACGFAIMPGDPVALCVDDKRIGKKEWKTYIGKDLLVCLRWECDNGPGFCGHWMGDRIKPAFADGGNHISQVFKTGEPLFTQIGPIDPSEPPSK